MKINWKREKELMDLVLGWRREGKSFGFITAALSEKLGTEITRNQIAGFLDRNFDGGPVRFVPKKKVREKKQPPPPPPPIKIVFPELEVAEAKVGIRLVDLTYFTCRWPLGDPWSDDFRFCGDEKQSGSVYCAAHHKLAYRVKPPRSREEAKADRARIHLMLRINNRERKRA